jgi:hypothetical protein
MFDFSRLVGLRDSVQKNQQQYASCQHACRNPELNIGQNSSDCLRSTQAIHCVSTFPGFDRFATATQCLRDVVALQ